MLLPTLDTCHRALVARDQRFDGVFFVGVTSTGIYCRPICRVRMPRRENCRFYPSAAAAEAAGFRPCLRCRPELAPGVAPFAAVERLAHAAVTRLQAEVFEDTTSLETLATGLGVTSRHLRRAVKAVYGASPVQLAQTHRLLHARRLLADTQLTVTEIAGASGFRSLRRFNTLFRKRYRLVPSKARFRSLGAKGNADSLKFQVAYRSPFAWPDLLKYFARRAIPGVEMHQHVVERTHTARTVVLPLEDDVRPAANADRLVPCAADAHAPAGNRVAEHALVPRARQERDGEELVHDAPR